MHGGKRSAASGRRPMLVVLAVALLARRLSQSSRPVPAATATGRRRSQHRRWSAREAGSARCTRRRPAPSRRRSSTPRSCRRTRRRATSRWPRFGRSDKKVNYALALKCWKNNGCTTGTGGKLTVAYIEQFGENVFRQMSKMEFILQALTYPAGRQDHLLERTLRPEPGDRRLQGGDRTEGQPDRHLSGLRRRDAAGDEGGNRRRNPRCDVCLGLRDRTGQELPDRRRRVHLQPRQGVRSRDEQAGQAPATSPSSAASRATRCRSAGRRARSRR